MSKQWFIQGQFCREGKKTLDEKGFSSEQWYLTYIHCEEDKRKKKNFPMKKTIQFSNSFFTCIKCWQMLPF